MPRKAARPKDEVNSLIINIQEIIKSDPNITRKNIAHRLEVERYVVDYLCKRHNIAASRGYMGPRRMDDVEEQPEAPFDPTPPSPAALRLAAFDPVVWRALHKRMGGDTSLLPSCPTMAQEKPPQEEET